MIPSTQMPKRDTGALEASSVFFDISCHSQSNGMTGLALPWSNYVKNRSQYQDSATYQDHPVWVSVSWLDYPALLSGISNQDTQMFGWSRYRVSCKGTRLIRI